jgi:NADH-quinone oxidoreductase subunit J
MILGVFWVFAGVAVVSAFLCITRRNPVASALWLILTLFCLAGIFVLLDAQFIAALQVLVYAGAIMVLFLFVIMLLNLQAEPREQQRRGVRRAALIGGGVLAVELFVLLRRLPTGDTPDRSPPEGFGTVQALSERLFTDFLLPFEITSILLLVAMVGAVVLAKRQG